MSVDQAGRPGCVLLGREAGGTDIDLLDDTLDRDAFGNDLKDPVVATEQKSECQQNQDEASDQGRCQGMLVDTGAFTGRPHTHLKTGPSEGDGEDEGDTGDVR